MQETGFDAWVGMIPWRREWLPTPVFLPRESHGQRSLAGYSLRGLSRQRTQLQADLDSQAASERTYPETP